MASDLSRMFHDDDANVLRFSEQELSEVLGMMESRGQSMCSGPAAAAAHAFGLSNFSPTDHQLDGMCLSQLETASLHLQFQPHSPGCASEGPYPGSMDNTSSMENNSAALGLDSYRAPSACDQHMQVQHILGAAPAPKKQSNNGTTTAYHASAAAPGAAAIAYQQTSFCGFPPFLPPTTAPPQQQQQPISSSTGPQRAAVEKQASVSHSSVEKQRRDRINSLIDELRDLVPPQKGSAAAAAPGMPGPRSSDGASAEARRPKHVVLADTITLLKNWRAACLQGGTQLPNPLAPAAAAAAPLAPAAAAAAAAAMAAVSIKEEPTPTDSAEPSPLMPNIPMSISSLAGVTVEKAKAPEGVMYVQVKCRDRRGLLSDIINSLKGLPLEIRTAAVVTSGDGMVRDVFEVRVDDPALTADAVQNVVHDGLYHQLCMRSDDGCGKRQKP